MDNIQTAVNKAMAQYSANRSVCNLGTGETVDIVDFIDMTEEASLAGIIDYELGLKPVLIADEAEREYYAQGYDNADLLDGVVRAMQAAGIDPASHTDHPKARSVLPPAKAKGESQ